MFSALLAAKRPSRRTVLVAGAAAGAILLILVVWLFVSLRPSVRVPSLVGITRAGAVQRADALGLKLVVKGTQLSPDVPKGAVASQDPTSGVLVPPGAEVTVLISAGADTFVVPDIIGLTLDAARTALRAKGLQVLFATAQSEQPTGTVIASLPAPGTKVSDGDVVRLTIATGGAVSTADLSDSSFVIDPVPPGTAQAVDPTFSVGRRLQDLLLAAGAAVTMTRDATGAAGQVGDAARLDRAKESSATVLIGLSIATTGLESLQVLSMPRAQVSASVAAASVPLSDAVFASLRADFATVSTLTAAVDPVLTGSGIAGVRVRLGSMLATSDRALFASPAWADRIAKDIFRGLVSVYARPS